MACIRRERGPGGGKVKPCLCGMEAYSCRVAPSGFVLEPGCSVLTPGKIHIKPSGGDGRLHNRGSAALLPFKYHSAPQFGFMSEGLCFSVPGAAS